MIMENNNNNNNKLLQNIKIYNKFINNNNNNKEEDENFFVFIETHINYIILIDTLAFKVKKSVNIGPPFVDQQELSQRKHLCEIELEKNLHWSNSDLYIQLSPLCLNKKNGEIYFSKNQHTKEGEEEEILDWAIVMHRFKNDSRLDFQLLLKKKESSELSSCMIEFGQRLARLQDTAEINFFVEKNKIVNLMLDNFEQLIENTKELRLIEMLKFQIKPWFCEYLKQCEELLISRQKQGKVRQLHADLHCSNLFLKDNKIEMFDCLEFNDDLSIIDVINDVSFLFMDLCIKDRKDLAYIFLNSWLEETGDYEAIELLTLFATHRSLVRAKIIAISPSSSKKKQEEFEKYLTLPFEFSKLTNGAIICMVGLSGSGKSYLSEKLISTLFAFRVRSDVERKRLMKNSTNDNNNNKRIFLYSKQVSDDTYNRLCEISKFSIRGKQICVLDATFLSLQRRIQLKEEILKNNKNNNNNNGVLNLIFIHCYVDDLNLLKQRILERTNDSSDATIQVLETQKLDEFLPTEVVIKMKTNYEQEALSIIQDSMQDFNEKSLEITVSELKRFRSEVLWMEPKFDSIESFENLSKWRDQLLIKLSHLHCEPENRSWTPHATLIKSYGRGAPKIDESIVMEGNDIILKQNLRLATTVNGVSLLSCKKNLHDDSYIQIGKDILFN